MKVKSYGICPYQIMNGDIYILMNKTSKSSWWNFFKGKQEKNEKPQETAIREFYEETGVLVDKKDLEDYFEQINTRKDIGIWLLDFTSYNNRQFNFQEKEIWSASWVNLSKTVETSKNQQKIYNKIYDFFLQKRKELHELYKLNIKD